MDIDQEENLIETMIKQADQPKARMLLSHNFNLVNGELPALTREEFAQIFIDDLQKQTKISCQLIVNPHWLVEIIFPTQEFTAEEVAKTCSQILSERRKAQTAQDQIMPDILFLGGKKSTPAIGASPTSLQLGEWGVDVVETLSADSFLAGLGWAEVSAAKPSGDIFKVELLGNKHS
jgi:hypothetical protein